MAWFHTAWMPMNRGRIAMMISGSHIRNESHCTQLLASQPYAPAIQDCDRLWRGRSPQWLSVGHLLCCELVYWKVSGRGERCLGCEGRQLRLLVWPYHVTQSEMAKVLRRSLHYCRDGAFALADYAPTSCLNIALACFSVKLLEPMT
jgi:hypothetical protein